MTNFRNFDLNLLLVLDGVLREGTLSNAAKALNVSQPTISLVQWLKRKVQAVG